MSNKLPHSVFVDGGTIGRNPSKIGGVYSWLWLGKEGEVITTGKGIVLPKEAGVKAVSNNVMELWAAVEGLKRLPSGWAGEVFTDSKVTLYRLESSQSFKGICHGLEQMTRVIRKRLRYKVVLVAGHPTKAELILGYRKRNGLPVSRWNRYCDERCRELAKEYWESQAA